jgi:hypothetical protein
MLKVMRAMRAMRAMWARLGRLAKLLPVVVRFVAEVTDRDVLARLGPRGMVAVTLPLLALTQSLLPRWGLLGGAALPLVWCAVCYYMLRFRLTFSLTAAVGGALLAWLASHLSFGSAGVLLLVAALACGFLRRWLYAEFWPAYAFASGAMVLAIALLALFAGVPSPLSGAGEFFGTLVVAPVVGTAMFVFLEAVRRRMGIEVDFPEEAEASFDPPYLYRPFASR